nr:cupredoxin domain-containing protein [Comamonas jiangduensis]
MKQPTLRTLTLAICALTLSGIAPTLHAAPQKAGTSASAQQGVKRFVLHTNVVDGKMVYVDDKGVANPTLTVAVGDTVEIELASGEGAEHDLRIDELGVASPKFSGKGTQRVRFTASQAGEFQYYCSIPGHRQVGMFGTIQVTGSSQPAKTASSTSSDAALALYTPITVPQRALTPRRWISRPAPPSCPHPLLRMPHRYRRCAWRRLSCPASSMTTPALPTGPSTARYPAPCCARGWATPLS